ncbi:MAG: sensor domain-containing diguanylate cyclase [Pseudomonadota bacterium]
MLFSIVTVLMRRFRIRTVNAALFLLVSICIIPTIFIAIAAIGYHYAETRQAMLDSSIRRVNSISATVDSTVKGIQVGLLTLASSPHLKQRDLAGFYRQARPLVDQLGTVRNIYLTDPSGQLLVNTLRPYPAVLPLTANPELVRQVVETGKIAVSDVFVGAVTGSPLVAIAVPVFVDDEVRFVLAATLSPLEMSAMLAQAHAPRDWIISIHDSQFKFIARTRDIAKYLGQAASRDLQGAMAMERSGTLEGTTREGIRVLAAFTRSSLTGWSVSVGIPTTKLLEELHFTIAALGLIAIAVIALGLGAATALALRIRQSITALVAPAEALSRSELVSVPDETFAETRLVALALQRTAEKLRQSEYDAQHDALTGLVNRSFLSAALPKYLSLSERKCTSLSILYIDLDGFKAVNDRLGHGGGDEVLCVSASRLVGAVRGCDISIRMGGDEFAVILQDTDEVGAAHTAAKLITELSRDIPTEFGTAAISASIGIAAYPADADSVDALLGSADAALYHAKRAGKNRYVLASAIAHKAS